MRYKRVKELFNKDFKKLQKANIIILGVGGVGGICFDCLYRSGVGNLTIVDFDKFDKTNFNRQILSENINQYKTRVFKKKYPNIKIITKKISTKWIEDFDFSKYDLIIDAIDDIKPKAKLISKYYYKTISSTGSARKIDPLKIQYIDIFKTYHDKFAKKLRLELKKLKFNKKFKVVFSDEIYSDKGSFMGVTGSFGLVMCSLAIQRIIK